MPELPTPPSADERLKQLRREKLKPFLHDVEIARAHEADQPHALYRLLLQKRKTASLADRPLIDELLANRRLFGAPLKKPPTMHTINGCGTSLYGKAEPDPADGTHIGTLFIVGVFAPLFPLASYLVLPAEKSGWYFLRKVPLNPKMRRWRQLTAAGMALAACVIAGLVYHAQTFTKVQLVNVLDVPVQVALDQASPVTVGPGKIGALHEVHRGRHHLTTRTVAGQVIEELDVDVPASQDVVVYNVLGAAPLFARGLIYYPKDKVPPAADNEKQEFQHYCGQRFIVRDHVRWVFRENEQTIDLKSNREVHWRFALDTGGWRKTVRVLEGERNVAAATALATKIARLEPDNELAVNFGLAYAAATQSNVAALALARELTALAPQSLPAHRGLQNLLADAGQQTECREQYRQLHAAHPDSPFYSYLHARTELPEAAAKLYPPLIERSPNDAYLRRGYAHTLFQLRRFAESLPHFEKFAALDPAGQDVLLDEHARALVALNRRADAIQLVGDRLHARAKTDGLETWFVLLYARLAALDPAAANRRPPEHYFEQLFAEKPLSTEARLWYASQVAPSQITDSLLAGTTNPPLRVAATIARDLAGNPTAALKLAGSLEPKQFARLPSAALVILAGSAVQGGDKPLAENLLAAVQTSHGPVLKSAILTGTDSPELADLDLEMQAALSFVRGETAKARADDLLQGPVTRAVAAKN